MRLGGAEVTVARRAAALLLLMTSMGCTSAPAMGDPTPTSPTRGAASAAATTAPSGMSPPVAASSAASPTATATPTSDAAATGPLDAGADHAARPLVKDNMVRPALESDELQDHARALFEAVTRDDPAVGDVFWFPKEPFLPLKDVKGPDKYWDNLHGTYASDIHALHRKRKSWEGTKFVKFEVGSPPKWVKPGEEANKIGYFRSFRGKLRYEVAGEASTIDVHTIISWQGTWFITHLRKFKK